MKYLGLLRRLTSKNLSGIQAFIPVFPVFLVFFSALGQDRPGAVVSHLINAQFVYMRHMWLNVSGVLFLFFYSCCL